MFTGLREKIKSLGAALERKRRGETNLVETVILVVIGFFVAAILMPSALTQIYGATTTGWNSAVVTVFQVLLPVLAVIGIALYFLPKIRGD
jgi:phage shock protein PspC (stress-responsive transcriptional regulator)